MAFKYYKKKRHITFAGMDEDRYVITLRAQKTLKDEDIASELANALSIEPSEALILVNELSRQISRAVLNGQSVKVEGLGTFTPALKVKSVKKADNVDAECIKQAKVNFRLDTKLKNRIARVPLEYDRNIDRKKIL